MNRRRFLWLIPGFLIPAVVKAEGEVSIPEGECVTACWDEQMQEVPCSPEEDVCPGYEPPAVTSGDAVVVVQLPSTGTGTTAEQGDWFISATSCHYWINSYDGWEIIPFKDVSGIGFAECPDAGWLEVALPPGEPFHHKVYFLGRRIQPIEFWGDTTS